MTQTRCQARAISAGGARVSGDLRVVRHAGNP